MKKPAKNHKDSPLHRANAEINKKSRKSRLERVPLARRIFGAHRLALICAGIVLCGFLLQRIGSEHVPPSNQTGKNSYFHEGGYYYDEFVLTLYSYVSTGRLPKKFETWQAYHPPLFTLLSGSYVFALVDHFGKSPQEAFEELLLIPGIIYILFAAASFWFFRQALFGLNFRYRDGLFALAFAVLVFNPGVFIQSLDFGNDLLVNLLILLTICSFIWYWRTSQPRRFNARCLAIGLSLGLAAYTKHTGFGFIPVVSVFLGFVVLSWILPRVFHKDAMNDENSGQDPHRPFLIQFLPALLRCAETAAALLIVFLIIQGEYLGNIKKYGKPMPSYVDDQIKDFKRPDVAKQRVAMWKYGFSPSLFVRHSYTPEYDKPLWDQPVYQNILLSMPALFWDDLGFYSKKGASFYYYYPPKKTPPLVRVLPFLLSMLLAIPFFWAMLKNFRQPEMLSIMAFLCMAFFLVAWYLRLLASADQVGVKAKYIIVMVPLFLGVALRGLGILFSGDKPWKRFLRPAVLSYLALLLAACFVYDVFFAIT